MSCKANKAAKDSTACSYTLLALQEWGGVVSLHYMTHSYVAWLQGGRWHDQEQ